MIDLVLSTCDKIETHVKEMTAENYDQKLHRILLELYTLRGAASVMPKDTPLMQVHVPGPQAQVFSEYDRLRVQGEARTAARLARVEESAPDMMVCEGGPQDEVRAPIDPRMPVGAYTSVAGTRYQLVNTDGRRRLVHAPVQPMQSK